MKKTVIIIGAGIGGLAAGARLLKKGYDVTIIEKNSYCGGKTSSLKAEGFTFDLTASIVMMPDGYKDLSDELGLGLNFIKHSYRYISKYVQNTKIRDFLAFQTMYIGVNPMKSSNMYTLIPVISAIKGLWYLKGGLSSLAAALEENIRRNGGTICLNTKCEKLICGENTIKSVVTDQGVLSAEVIVCNSDYSYSIQKYLDNQSCKSENGKCRGFQYSCSVFVLYLGLKKKYDCLSVHNIYIGPNFKQNIKAAFKGSVPSDPPLYLYCPSKVDDTMAPQGKDAINVMIRVPNTRNKKIVWDEKLVKKIRDKSIQSLQRMKGLEDINENIEFESCLTPNDLDAKFNCMYGNAFGISHKLTQTAFLRPQIKSRDYDNLYFVGDSVHPGTGVSLVLLGSKLLCEYL